MRVAVLLKELRRRQGPSPSSPPNKLKHKEQRRTQEQGFIETKTFCASKDKIKKVKRQPAGQEKMPANEGSVPRTHKELPLNHTHTQNN